MENSQPSTQCTTSYVPDYMYMTCVLTTSHDYTHQCATLQMGSSHRQREPYCILSVVSRHIIILIKYCL